MMKLAVKDRLQHLIRFILFGFILLIGKRLEKVDACEVDHGMIPVHHGLRDAVKKEGLAGAGIPAKQQVPLLLRVIREATAPVYEVVPHVPHVLKIRRIRTDHRAVVIDGQIKGIEIFRTNDGGNPGLSVQELHLHLAVAVTLLAAVRAFDIALVMAVRTLVNRLEVVLRQAMLLKKRLSPGGRSLNFFLISARA